MANKRSSKKDLRRIAKRTVRNKGTKTALKTYVKKVKTTATAGTDTAAVQTALTVIFAMPSVDNSARAGR